MLVSKKLLPEDQRNWHSFLRDYFCDKDAIATLKDDLVELQLEWPAGLDRHVDPNLQAGLDWWGRGVALQSMWSARWRDRKILTALYDTWTLHSWSEWLARTSVARAREVILLHIDDHRDLGTPRLLHKNDQFQDAITGNSVDLRSPGSVQNAIASGAVGMGSFMTPFIHEVPSACVRHLCQPPKVRQTISSRLVLTDESDTLLYPGMQRPAIEYVPVAPGAASSYVATSDLGIWANNIEGRPVLVHIDMDYFNNRYDGDSAWRERAEPLDPIESIIFEKIDEIVDALASSRAEIEDVTIAYSPGFFPAECWEAADKRLRAGLEKIL